jgi:Flp pilus assembly protein TadD
MLYYLRFILQFKPRNRFSSHNLCNWKVNDDSDSSCSEHDSAVSHEVTGNGDVHHALGLSLVRQKRMAEALKALEQAVRLSPGNARYVYVYAVALNSTDNTAKAIMVLQGAHNRFPNNTDILNALVAFHRDNGNTKAARTYVDKLRSLSP